MNIKRLLSACALGVVLTLSAEAQVYNVPTGVTGAGEKFLSEGNENPLKKRRPPRGWFIEAGIGVNAGFNGQGFKDRTQSGAGVGTAMDFTLGMHRQGKFLGFAAGLQGLSISDTYTEYGSRQYMYAHADMLMRAEDWLVPYVHAGVAYSRKLSPAGGLGIRLPIRFTPSISLVPDLRVSVVRGNLFSDEGAAVGAVASATVGLRFTFGNQERRQRAQKRINELYDEDALLTIPDKVVEETPAPPERDTVYIRVRDTVRVESRYYYMNEVRETVTQPAPQQTVTEEVHREKEQAFNRSLSEAVLFETGSYVLTFSAKLILNEVADYIINNSGLSTVVEGHTDDVGGDEMNLRLSRNRAAAVVDYLVSQGVNPYMITSIGYGKSRPKVPNTSAENRRQNRRVEIHFNPAR